MQLRRALQGMPSVAGNHGGGVWKWRLRRCTETYRFARARAAHSAPPYAHRQCRADQSSPDGRVPGHFGETLPRSTGCQAQQGGRRHVEVPLLRIRTSAHAWDRTVRPAPREGPRRRCLLLGIQKKTENGSPGWAQQLYDAPRLRREFAGVGCVESRDRERLATHAGTLYAATLRRLRGKSAELRARHSAVLG